MHMYIFLCLDGLCSFLLGCCNLPDSPCRVPARLDMKSSKSGANDQISAINGEFIFNTCRRKMDGHVAICPIPEEEAFCQNATHQCSTGTLSCLSRFFFFFW